MFERINSKTPKNPEPQQPTAPTPTPMTQPQAEAPTRPTSSAPTSPPVSVTSQAPGGQRNILSNDVHIKGSVKFTNDLLVDGRIEGEISSDGALTVAENAHIKAEVRTKSVVIYGKVHGNITAVDRVDIKESAEMVGDVKAATLSIEPGAIFVGKSEVGASAPAPKENSPAAGQKQPESKGNQSHQSSKPQKGPAKTS